MTHPESILCDIDGVLADASAPILKAINSRFSTKHRKEDWNSWEWPIEQVVLLSQLDIPTVATWLFSTQHLSQAEPIREAQSVLQSWQKQGTRIRVATSRAAEQADMSRDWLAQHYPFIHLEDIHIRTDRNIKGPAFKQQVAETFNPDLYFEDEAKTLLALLQVWPKNRHAILKLIDQPWNKDAMELDIYRTQWNNLR